MYSERPVFGQIGFPDTVVDFKHFNLKKFTVQYFIILQDFSRFFKTYIEKHHKYKFYDG